MRCTYLILENYLLGRISTYLLENGQLWFAGYGIAKKLGHANPSYAIKLKCPHMKRLVFTENQTGDVNTIIVIQATDLVDLILKSKMPDAAVYRVKIEDQTEPETLFDLEHAQILSRVEGTATFLAHGAKPPIVLPKITEDEANNNEQCPSEDEQLATTSSENSSLQNLPDPTQYGLPDFRDPLVACEAWMEQVKALDDVQKKYDALQAELTNMKEKLGYGTEYNTVAGFLYSSAIPFRKDSTTKMWVGGYLSRISRKMGVEVSWCEILHYGIRKRAYHHDVIANFCDWFLANQDSKSRFLLAETLEQQDTPCAK